MKKLTVAPPLRRLWRIVAVLGGIMGAGLLWQPVGAAITAETPPGFAVRQLVGNLHQPVDMAILPNDELLIAEKGSGGIAQVRLAHADGEARRGASPAGDGGSPSAGDHPATTTVVEVPVNALGDTGLLGLILDPNFAANGYFYLWYAAGLSETVMRLSRFTFDAPTGTANPASETIILDGVPWHNIHNGGGLAFDAEGNLLLATGDIAAPLDPAINWAQAPSSLNGKVLRIRPLPGGGYSVPADNPFVGVDGYMPEIYALGLRNPFRMTNHPVDGRHYLIDVGLDAWEEINRVAPGVNYGWPVREGPCALGQLPAGCTPPSGDDYTEPVAAYRHGEDGGGITALAIYDGDAFPPSYRGRVYFADINDRWVAMRDLSAATTVAPTIVITEAGHIVDMEATATGIYLLDIYSGTVSHFFYTANFNQPPVARLAVTPTLAAAPVQITASAEGSGDADDATLFYEWNFDDGTGWITTATPVQLITYAADGVHQIRLRVRDGRGGLSQEVAGTVTVYSGELPTIVAENLTTPTRTVFYGGDAWRLRAERTSGTADLDAQLPYRWDLELVHNLHSHPELTGAVGPSLVYTTAVEGHGAGSIWYRVRLTMRTAAGLDVAVTRELLPQLVSTTLATWPVQDGVTLNGQRYSTGTTATVMAGHRYELDAADKLYVDTGIWRFDGWRVTDALPTSQAPPAGDAITERSPAVMVPSVPVVYVATYRWAGSATHVSIPLVAAAD